MKQKLPFLCLIFWLCSCQSSTPDSPKKNVAAFIEAAKKRDFDEIKRQITKSDASFLEIGENLLSQLDSTDSGKMRDEITRTFSNQTDGIAIEIKEEKIEGNNATVNVSFSKGGSTETRLFKLQKEDGKWKISLLSSGL